MEALKKIPRIVEEEDLGSYSLPKNKERAFLAPSNDESYVIDQPRHEPFKEPVNNENFVPSPEGAAKVITNDSVYFSPYTDENIEEIRYLKPKEGEPALEILDEDIKKISDFLGEEELISADFDSSDKAFFIGVKIEVRKSDIASKINKTFLKYGAFPAAAAMAVGYGSSLLSLIPNTLLITAGTTSFAAVALAISGLSWLIKTRKNIQQAKEVEELLK